MKTAVAYIRVSKLKEDAVSPHSQLQMFRNWCEVNNVQLVDVFRDLDLSGREYARHQRGDLQRMIDFVNQGGIDYVLVYKFDRLTRGGSRDFYKIVEGFDQVGTAVVSISENIDTSTAVGEMLRDIMLGMAKAESERIGERIRDNLSYVVKHRRKWVSGRPPLGYRTGPEGLVVDPNMAKVVRYIFRRYADGDGARTIARYLTQRNIPTPSGARRWHYSTVINILSSRAYIGEIKWGKDWYPGNHEPIIDRDMFDQVQALREANTHVGSAPRGDRVLTGRLRCGICKKAGTIKYGYNKLIRYWCSERHQVGKEACFNVALDEPSLVAWVQQAIAEQVDSRTIHKAERSLPTTPTSSVDDELEAVDRRLRQIKTLLDRLFSDHYEHGIITQEQFADQNRRYLDEQAALNAQREKLLSRANPQTIDKEALALAIETADALTAGWDELTPQERRLAIGFLVKEIVWMPEWAEIVWHWGERTRKRYNLVSRGTAYLDDSWIHPCEHCGYPAKTAAGLASHQRRCSR